MAHHWLARGNELDCVTVDDHNRCAEVPPGLSEWQWRPWPDLCRWAERQGDAAWGELSGDCLLSYEGES